MSEELEVPGMTRNAVQSSTLVEVKLLLLWKSNFLITGLLPVIVQMVRNPAHQKIQ